MSAAARARVRSLQPAPERRRQSAAAGKPEYSRRSNQLHSVILPLLTFRRRPDYSDNCHAGANQTRVNH